MIENVAVDVTGNNALDARDKALNQARRNAFSILSRRLDLGGDVIAEDDRTIATLVDSFEINREKLSSNRYMASINVLFNEPAIQGYLGQNKPNDINRETPYLTHPADFISHG